MQNAWKELRIQDAIQNTKEKRWLFIAVIVGCGIYTALAYTSIRRHAEKRAKAERAAFVEKLAELPSMEAIERRLLTQKSELAVTEANLEQLKAEALRLSAEKAELVRALKTDRESLEAIFVLQQKKNQANSTRDTTISFVFGVTSSLLATYLALGIAKLRSSFKPSSVDPSDSPPSTPL